VSGDGRLREGAVVASWAAIDRRPPEWDHANHLERAVLCACDLRTGDVRAILERSSFYRPLVFCLAGGASMAMPMEAAAALTTAAFLGLGMAAVYLLGRSVAGAPAGVAAALLFATAPFVVFSSLRFQLDLPLAAIIATVRARRVPAVTGTPPPAVAAAIEAGLRGRLHEVARDVERLEIRLLHDEGILSGRRPPRWPSTRGRTRRGCACAI